MAYRSYTLLLLAEFLLIQTLVMGTYGGGSGGDSDGDTIEVKSSGSGIFGRLLGGRTPKGVVSSVGGKTTGSQEVDFSPIVFLENHKKDFANSEYIIQSAIDMYNRQTSDELKKEVDEFLKSKIKWEKPKPVPLEKNTINKRSMYMLRHIMNGDTNYPSKEFNFSVLKSLLRNGSYKWNEGNYDRLWKQNPKGTENVQYVLE